MSDKNTEIMDLQNLSAALRNAAPPKTIVLADELAMVREGIAELCSAKGCYRVVAHCSDGASALDAVRQHRPDIVVIDFNIPKLFSLEAIRQIHALPNPPLTVVLSARGDRKQVLECLRAGVNAFVLKAGPGRNLIDAFEQIGMGGIYVSPELHLERIFASSARRVEHSDPLESLSSREYQVFSLLIDGVRAKEIASRLDLSPKTVDTYRASLMRKLDIHDVAGLVKFAIQREITTLS
jgi:two-component system, NarL family, response regulator NreC